MISFHSFLVESKTDKVWMFSYDSNMDEKRLEARIGYIPQKMVGELKGWKLNFQKAVKKGAINVRWNRGYTGIEEDSGSIVYGVAFLVSQKDIKTIDKYEGEGKDYDRIDIDIKLANDRTVKAVTYIPKITILDPVLPKKKYLDYVLKGSRDLPSNYRDAIKKLGKG